ncbi:proximal tail sheath stabilization [Synechococcus phage DSL-LC02]|nr:proximal tail sheath stabilization [Synechococcus phage DSL-LC02]
MLGSYFYHEVLRKTVIGFGTLFNNIKIVHKNENGSDASIMKVPIAYGPIQKFLARIEQQPDLASKQTLTLPRLSFEMKGLQYDPSRKTTIVQTFKTTNDGTPVKVYMPVPYNVSFELNLMTKLNEDALQIIEQILPFFQPSLNITIDLVSSIGEQKDIPIVLEGIMFQDNYVGGFDERRVLIYTLNFTAKTVLFGPIANSTDGLIKKVQVDYSSNQQRTREMRYTATPKALQDYNDDGVVNATDDPLIPYGDDFGFNETISEFRDYRDYSPSQGTDV